METTVAGEGTRGTPLRAGALSAAEVAAAAHLTVPQVRDLHQLGVTDAAGPVGGGSGFSREHVVCLRAYLDLALAVGEVVARRTMRELAGSAAAAGLGERLEFFGASIGHQYAVARTARDAVREVEQGSAPSAGDRPLSTEALCTELGVNASTLRFWVISGFVAPQRNTGDDVDLWCYPPIAAREARIVAGLRCTGLTVAELHLAMTEIRWQGDVGRLPALLDARLAEIAGRQAALERATSRLARFVSTAGLDRGPAFTCR